MKRIYLDYASLTPLDKGVMKVMKKYSSNEYTNPSTLYLSGVKAEIAIDEARKEVADILHAHPDEIYFTHGGTHGNDLILNDKKKIIISSIEHSSIINFHESIKIPVDSMGVIDLEILKKTLTPEISVVSVMMVNNEIGTLQPIHDIVKIVRDFNKINNTHILVHTDACQAPVYFPIHIEKIGVDLMTLDGQKMHGPRGSGAIYVKRGSMKIEERGTLNVPGIKGFAYALKLCEKLREDETKRIMEIKDFFAKELRSSLKITKINGSLENSSPHILNVSFPNIDNEFFILQLDANGIECSTKSACLRDMDESYVLKAIGADSRSAVRFSFGRETRKRHLKKVLAVISRLLN